MYPRLADVISFDGSVKAAALIQGTEFRLSRESFHNVEWLGDRLGLFQNLGDNLDRSHPTDVLGSLKLIRCGWNSVRPMRRFNRSSL
jgi:hypothetical protein